MEGSILDQNVENLAKKNIEMFLENREREARADLEALVRSNPLGFWERREKRQLIARKRRTLEKIQRQRFMMRQGVLF